MSDNTRHRALHHPITTTSPSHQPSSTSTRKTSLNIPSIPEVNTDDLPSNITSIPEDRIVDPSLYLSHDDRDCLWNQAQSESSFLHDFHWLFS